VTELRLLGYVEIDSGTLLVGDPGYVLPRAADGRTGVDYQAVIDARSVPAQALAGQPVLLLSNFGGDGTFPVYGEFDEGELVRVTIEFEGPSGDDDEDDA
jgi:hypothetical protein